MWKALHFINENEGTVLSALGTLYHTLDGGISWQFQGVYGSTNNIHYINSGRGWCVGGTQGTFIAKRDNWDDWELQMDETRIPLNAIFFINEDEGYAGGGHYYNVEGFSPDVIMHTNNGGLDWEKQLDVLGKGIYDVKFLDNMRGYALSRNGIYETTNGGESWNFISVARSGLASISMLDKNIGYLAGHYSQIYKTTNGGNTWNSLYPGVGNTYFQSIHFVDENNGWASGYGLPALSTFTSKIIHTSNGGNTWEIQYNEPGGRTWSHFLDLLNGWAVSLEGVVLQTKDGGTTWNQQLSNVSEDLRDIYFISTEIGYAVGDNGTIIKTNDSGNIWVEENSPSNAHLYSVFASTSGNIWATGNNGIILKKVVVLNANAPDMFTLLVPVDGEEVLSLTPLLDWSIATDPDTNDVVKYTLFLDTPEPGIENFKVDTSTSYQISYPLNDNTTYYWKVVAHDLTGFSTENEGGYYSFVTNIENDPPSAVSLLTPDSVVVIDLTPHFYWEEAIDLDPKDTLIYHILWRLIGSSSFDSLEVDTNSFVPTIPLVDNSEYCWHVKTYDNHGAMSISDSSVFWTDSYPEPPIAFTTIAPGDSAIDLSTTVDFIWNSTTDPDPLDKVHYTLIYATNWDDSSTYNRINVNEDTTALVTLNDRTKYFWLVEAVDEDSLITQSNKGKPKLLSVGLSVITEGLMPTEFALHQNYPNPFNPVTTINYELPEQSQVLINIYDILGREIRKLVNTTQDAGYKSVIWDGTDEFGRSVGTGIYLYQINTSDFSQTRKMLLLR